MVELAHPRSPERPVAGNDELAGRLDEIADLLELQEANEFRVHAYRAAAGTLRGLDVPIATILAERGTPGLVVLPTIGKSIARTLTDLIENGRSPVLERLRGDHAPEDALTSLTGLGPALAQRIHEELGVDTLTDLEAAASDGRLARVRGMGAGRVRLVREALAGRFGHPAPRLPAYVAPDDPPVEELLDVDREYRGQARAGRLMKIAPRRFNPQHDAWLPILHCARGERHYTALFSNTARAHALGKTHDWVVIYRDDRGGRGQWTVVTGSAGSLAGRRVVRGRERECREAQDPWSRERPGATGRRSCRPPDLAAVRPGSS